VVEAEDVAELEVGLDHERVGGFGSGADEGEQSEGQDRSEARVHGRGSWEFIPIEADLEG
jgi:hypothetical protein